MGYDKSRIRLSDFDRAPKRFVVFGGMPKTGTTLPLTLLDGHSKVVVYPEELRFFHVDCHRLPPQEAAEVFLANVNTQMLNLRKAFFESSDYMSHRGTGFGERDYSSFDFSIFQSQVRQYFAVASSIRQRFLGIVLAFMEAANFGIYDDLIFATKAPRNELYGELWNSILADEGRYVMTTRIPTEHYVSLSNIHKMGNSGTLRPARFVRDVYKCYRSWNKLPKENVFVLDYDKLLSNVESTLSQLLVFLDLRFEKVCSEPTKMGTPWSGNSSKGVVGCKVYPNPHVAKQSLSPKTYSFIEHELDELYHELQWSISSESKIFDRAFFWSSDFMWRVANKMGRVASKLRRTVRR